MMDDMIGEGEKVGIPMEGSVWIRDSMADHDRMMTEGGREGVQRNGGIQNFKMTENRGQYIYIYYSTKF